MSKSCILYSGEHEVLFPKAAKFVKMKPSYDVTDRKAQSKQALSYTTEV